MAEKLAVSKPNLAATSGSDNWALIYANPNKALGKPNTPLIVHGNAPRNCKGKWNQCDKYK
jgi:hypothetical protein